MVVVRRELHVGSIVVVGRAVCPSRTSWISTGIGAIGSRKVDEINRRHTVRLLPPSSHEGWRKHVTWSTTLLEL